MLIGAHKERCETQNDEFQARIDELERIACATGRGLLLLRSGGRLAQATKTLKGQVQKWPMTILNDFLILEDPESHSAFMSEISACLTGVFSGGVKALKRDDGRPPIFLKVFNTGLDGVAGVFVRDSLWIEESDMLVLAKLFETTRRESQLALHISSGSSMQHFAADNYLAMNTVKTHLRQVFKKVGVNSQVQLVSVVLAALR